MERSVAEALSIQQTRKKEVPSQQTRKQEVWDQKLQSSALSDLILPARPTKAGAQNTSRGNCSQLFTAFVRVHLQPLHPWSVSPTPMPCRKQPPTAEGDL